MTKATFAVSALDMERATSVYEALRRTRPRTKRDLRNYVKVFLGIDVPDRSICADHSSPMDYLWHCFSADFGTRRAGSADAVVWANRGGGKTKLAAVATLLDCVFKAACQVRILGGSGEQSGRLYEYLTCFLQNGFGQFLLGPVLKERCSFANGSRVEVLTQSHTSVRGQHIQKLRCDEVDLFDPDVLAAANFTTQSSAGITAAMETLSTMHRPYGLMQELVSSAQERGTPVFKWCMWEVIERCRGRDCSQCPLYEDCHGKAKRARGYLKIDDCISAMLRSSRTGWEAEMLCKRPSLEHVVFDQFDPAVHVKRVDYDPNLPLYRSLDFGYVNPFVCLWIQDDGEGVVRVIDEYVRRRATIDVNAAQIKRRTVGGEDRVRATFCDPAGGGANDVTGTSAIRELRSLGIVVRHRRSGILEGIELIRQALKAGDDTSRLVISPQCPRLIEAMQCYHYPESGSAAAGELPQKDGVYDHPIDALRYFFVNYQRSTKVTVRRY